MSVEQFLNQQILELRDQRASLNARIAELEASVDLLHNHTYLDRCGCHWCLAARKWSKEKLALSERVSSISAALDKMHGLVDSACVEAKHFGPRADSNDGKSLSLVLGDIRVRADALAKVATARQDCPHPSRAGNGFGRFICSACGEDLPGVEVSKVTSALLTVNQTGDTVRSQQVYCNRCEGRNGHAPDCVKNSSAPQDKAGIRPEDHEQRGEAEERGVAYMGMQEVAPLKADSSAAPSTNLEGTAQDTNG